MGAPIWTLTPTESIDIPRRMLLTVSKFLTLREVLMINQKKSSVPDPAKAQVKKMATEVLAILTKRTAEPLMKLEMSAFRAAFAAVAHGAGIYHNQNRGSYNFFFGEVRIEVSRRLAVTKKMSGSAKALHGAAPDSPQLTLS